MAFNASVLRKISCLPTRAFLPLHRERDLLQHLFPIFCHSNLLKEIVMLNCADLLREAPRLNGSKLVLFDCD